MELKSQKWREISLAAELLIVLNGIEISPDGIVKTLHVHLLIVLNGIEIREAREASLSCLYLLIVLNGIEIDNGEWVYGDLLTFNRTKWN